MTSSELVDPGAEPSTVGGYFADPALAVVDGRFMLVPTVDGLREWSSNRFVLFSSSDLVEWEDHGTILTLGTDVAWESERAWAPMLVAHGGRCFLYFSANDNIGVAVSDGVLGPYVDSGRPLIPAGAYSGRAIDPSVFTDDDGQAYLLWGNTVAHIVPLNKDMISFDPAKIVSWDIPGFREAPWMHRRGDVYYLSWSEDDTRSPDYHVTYASGPSPMGPWGASSVLVASRPEAEIFGTGHHSIVRCPETDDWIIAYHRFAIPAGDGFHRELAFDRLHHNDDGSLRQVTPSSHPVTITLTS